MAWPATSESDPLYLMAATSASTAASNWIGPSMGYSLHRLLALAVASRIVSMSAPWLPVRNQILRRRAIDVCSMA